MQRVYSYKQIQQSTIEEKPNSNEQTFDQIDGIQQEEGEGPLSDRDNINNNNHVLDDDDDEEVIKAEVSSE
jgi:hypothetical protein